MCGIVGILSTEPAAAQAIEALKRLEYRGYDSAGVAVAVDGTLKRLRSTGRVAELAGAAEREKLSGNTGIAHTRWATHGEPSEKNAHPHVSGGIAVVHNGIIENHEAIRARLRAAGYKFTSDTDTEVIAHLIQEHRRQTPDIFAATRAAVVELTGAFAIAVVSETEPERAIVARQGAPLLLGIGDGAGDRRADRRWARGRVAGARAVRLGGPGHRRHRGRAVDRLLGSLCDRVERESGAG